MKAAFAVSEAVPFAKTGGLADVAGALPMRLRKMSIDTDVFMPKYKNIDAPVIDSVTISMGKDHKVDVRRLENNYFIDVPHFFERDGLYGDSKGDYPDNCERFVLFCRAVHEFIKHRDYDIIHCHDWQSALIPLYLRDSGSKIRSIFTIHNIGYQGRFPADKYDLLGLKHDYFTIDGLEYYGDMNFLKAGIVFSDMITTVSRTYALEIQNPEYGFGLEGILKKRSKDLTGIVNGIDTRLWDPAKDRAIYFQYRDIEGKRQNKAALAAELGLSFNRPLIGMVSRIADQKGFDLLLKIFEDMIALGLNIVILGTGDRKLESKLADYEGIYPDRVSTHLKFDDRLAHRIYAGSDFFLMPSRYEPCGLGQLIAFKYGSIPIVRATGGLADTVIDFKVNSEQGSGICFTEYESRDLLESLEKASDLYSQEREYHTVVERIMALDFSWERSARLYKKLYENVLSRPLDR